MGQKRIITRLRSVVFAGCLLALTYWIFHTSLSLPYLSDDFEHIQLICEIRAGLRPWTDLLRVPFHGQTLVLLRLLFWFGTLPGHMSITWVRVGVMAVHTAGAFGCGVLCKRWTRSESAGYFAAVLYAASAGFIGDTISWPSSSIFCLGATFYIFSLAALSSQRLRPAAGMALSILALGAPLLRRDRERSGDCVVAGFQAGEVGVPFLLNQRSHDGRVAGDHRASALRVFVDHTPESRLSDDCSLVRGALDTPVGGPAPDAPASSPHPAADLDSGGHAGLSHWVCTSAAVGHRSIWARRPVC